MVARRLLLWLLTLLAASLSLSRAHGAAATGLVSPFLHRLRAALPDPADVDVKKSLRELPAEAGKMLRRAPALPVALLKSGGVSFLQTAGVMIPLGLVINVKLLFKVGAKAWLKQGSKLGMDWASISGLFAGGETFFATLRGSEDRWNVYLGSGLASAVMGGAKEGWPMGAVQGFAAGFFFMLAVDQFLPPEGVPTVPMSARDAARRSAAMNPAVARKSATAAAAVRRYKKGF